MNERQWVPVAEANMDEAVRTMFEQYAAAFSELDVGLQVTFFAESFISAGPRGSIALGREDFTRQAARAADFYHSVGQTEARILGLREFQISDKYSMVPVHWGARFKKTGPRWIEFIAHQDEEKQMRELGLLMEPNPPPAAV